MSLNMVEVFDDKTIYMSEVDKLIGSETKWAEKKRIQRAKEDNVPLLSSKCPTELEKEKEKELYIEQDVDVDVTDTSGDFSTENNYLSTNSKFDKLCGSLGKGVVMLTPEQDDALLDKLGFHAYNHYIERLANFIIENDANVKNHYATILKWAKEDAKV